MKKILPIGLFSCLIMNSAHARVLYNNDYLDGTSSESFTLNRANFESQTELIFGDTLGAKIMFDSTTDSFSISKSVDFQSQATKNFVLEQGTVFPTNPEEGQVFYRTDQKQSFLYDGVTWTSKADSNIIQFTATIPAGTTRSFSHAPDPDLKRITNVLKLEIPDTLVSPGWTPYDPMNYSSLDANINDQNVSTIWYNNTSMGPTNKWIGFDSGTTATLEKFTIYDYQSAPIYVCTAMEFESSADGTNWTSQMSITGHAYNASGTTYTFPNPITDQYFRLRCLTPTNSSWWVVSGLDLFEMPGRQQWVSPSNIKLKIETATETTVTNNGADADFKINILLP